jgi:hypothetical protein
MPATVRRHKDSVTPAAVIDYRPSFSAEEGTAREAAAQPLGNRRRLTRWCRRRR